MNLALAATSFALVIPAELPDKTFISTVVLSTRHRPLAVWLGAAGGLVVQAATAVTLGRILGLLPRRTVDLVVAAMFLAGGAYLLLRPEKVEEDEATEVTEREEQKRLAPSAGRERALRVVATSFFVIAIAEIGDLTQVLIANLSARTRDPVSVFVGAAIAFVLISGVGVALGQTLVRVVPLDLVRKISGGILVALGIWSLVEGL